MSFHTPVFLFFFLPAILLLFILLKPRTRGVLLFVASLIFYAWGEGLYLLVLICSWLGNYMFGLLIGAGRDKKKGKVWFSFALVFNLGMLVLFKFSPFLAAGLNVFLRQLGLGPLAIVSAHMPMGISFFTFRAISYLIDVRQGLKPPEKNPLFVGLAIALFPQIGAGPRGDLAAMLSLSDVLYDPQSVKVTPRFSSRVIVTEPARWIDENLQREVTVCPGAELPEALMFRDSFGYALAGFLSEHFQKITYVRDIGLGFYPDIVLKVRPKIVIQEMAERFFQVLSPFNSAELAAIDVDR